MGTQKTKASQARARDSWNKKNKENIKSLTLKAYNDDTKLFELFKLVDGDSNIKKLRVLLSVYDEYIKNTEYKKIIENHYGIKYKIKRYFSIAK